MSNFDKNRFASNNQTYETPQELFDVLNDEFHFTIDVCADDINKKCERYFSENEDSLSLDWRGSCWMNPPFKKMKDWIIKAYNESRKEGTIVVCLIPARTNNRWWHEYCMKGEIRFVNGRVKFKGCKHGLPQPLAVVIFGTDYSGNYKSVKYKQKRVSV